jgi:hypothetical protein
VNCDTFKNKLPEFLNHELFDDMKNSMQKHMKECSNCQKLYEEELYINDLLKEALDNDNIKFNSCRNSVMKQIDKNKYSKNTFNLNKTYYRVKKQLFKYSSLAAVLVIALFTSVEMNTIGNENLKTYNLVSNDQNSINETRNEQVAISEPISQNKTDDKHIEDKKQNVQDEKEKAVQKSNTYEVAKAEPASSVSTNESKQTPVGKNTTPSTEQKVESDTSSRANGSSSVGVGISKFSIQPLTTLSSEQEASTVWKTSSDKSVKIGMIGKGDINKDQGIATIAVEYLNENKQIRLVAEGNGLETPRYIEWFDNKTILCIIGPAYEVNSYGGNLYKVNISDGSIESVYKVSSSYEQVIDAKKVDTGFEITIRQFDENFTKSQDRKQIIQIK